jgi:hypothetical protein
MSMPVSVKKKDAGRIPGPQNVPNTMEIRCQFSLPNGKIIYSTFHGSYASTPGNTQSMATALYGSLSSAWGSNLGPYMANATSFTNVWLRDMSNFTLPVYQGTGAAVVGTGGAVAMPENNAIVLTENILQRGRGAKGRVFLGGWAQNADVTIGGISTVVQTALNAFGTAVFNAITAQSLTPCVAQVARQQYQGVTGTVHPQRNPNHVNVTSYTCRDLVWDTQRRRVQL